MAAVGGHAARQAGASDCPDSVHAGILAILTGLRPIAMLLSLDAGALPFSLPDGEGIILETFRCLNACGAC